MGDWDGAREDLAESEELPLAEARQALTNVAYALIEAATGHEDAARRRLAEAERLAAFIESLPQAVSLAILKAVTHLVLGEPSASLAAIEQASGGGSDITLQEWHQAAAAALTIASSRGLATTASSPTLASRSTRGAPYRRPWRSNSTATPGPRTARYSGPPPMRPASP